MRKRLLIIAPRDPLPISGGDHLRIFKIADFLREDFDIDFLTLTKQTSKFSSHESFKFIHHNIPMPMRLLNSCIGLFSKYPIQCNYYYDHKIHKKIKSIQQDYDAIIFHLIRCIKYSEGIKVPMFLEMTDAISLNYSRYKSKGIMDMNSWLYKLESQRLSAVESASAKIFKKTIVISETDQQYLLKNGSPKESLAVIKNGVENNSNIFKYSKSNNIALFIGNMKSMQNQSMCDYFLDNILTEIKTKIPNFKIRIAGNCPDSYRRKIEKYNDVEVYGSYKNLEEISKNCFMGFCTMQFGAGIQNKILDYMSIGLPVVSTDIGNEGINARNNEAIILANYKEEFINSIYSLWSSESLSEKISLNGHKHVLDNFGWNSCLTGYKDLLTRFL